jgi:hypothetical protein
MFKHLIKCSGAGNNSQSIFYLKQKILLILQINQKNLEKDIKKCIKIENKFCMVCYKFEVIIYQTKEI